MLGPVRYQGSVAVEALAQDFGVITEQGAPALMDHRGLHVITNNLNVAMTLSSNPSSEVIVAGGRVRHPDRIDEVRLRTASMSI